MTQVLGIYETSTKRKLISSLITFILMSIMFLILAAVRQKSGPGLGAALGMTIAFYFITYPKYSVFADQISFKVSFKKINCPFNAGTFKLVEKTGLMSLLLSMKSSTYVIEYSPDNTKKKIVMGSLLSKAAVEAMFNQIPEQSKI